MSAPKVHIILPDLWAHCPFPVKLHDNSEEVISQSQKWFDNSCTTLFAPSSPYATARETVDSAGVGQMIAYCFPNASEKRFRILCDLGFILFLLDDLGDEMVPAEWENVKIAVEDVLKTGKIAEQGVEGDLAQLFAGWWERVKTDLDPSHQARFVDTFIAYLEGVGLEAEHRDSGHIHPSHEEYIEHRRLTTGCSPLLELVEYSAGIELPEEVRSHPALVTMKNAVNDYISLTNDIFSYKKEWQKEHNHNMVIISCKKHEKELQHAIDHVGELAMNAVDTYLDAKAKLPFQSEEITAYCGVLESGVSGSLEWSVSISRYFGTEGGTIKESKKAMLH